MNIGVGFLLSKGNLKDSSVNVSFDLSQSLFSSDNCYYQQLSTLRYSVATHAVSTTFESVHEDI